MSKGVLKLAPVLLAAALGTGGCTTPTTEENPCARYGMNELTTEQADAAVGRDALRLAFARAPLADPVFTAQSPEGDRTLMIIRGQYGLSGNYAGVLDLNIKNAYKCE